MPLAVPQAIAGALALLLAMFGAWAMFADNPFGGEPMVVVSANPPERSAAGASDDASGPAGGAGRPERPSRYDGPGSSESQAAGSAAATPAAPSGGKTVTIIDGRSGKREEVLLPGPADAKAPGEKLSPREARIPEAKAPAAAGRPAGIEGKAAGEQRFAESSRHGLIPKIADDGTRPADAFARPVVTGPAKPNTPQIAIVVGGLGVSTSKSSDAISKLPGSITLAFAPYGGELDQMASRARDAGHELLLQVPMEPFDYPDNDPGPQTLLTSLDATQNLDRLYWLMSRLRGYVGIANFMGARFTASEQSLAPVLRETGKRGLIYVDDGSSGRSLAGQIAGANNLPFAKADVVLDTVPAAADVDRALSRLEVIARERGVALGVAHALPVSIERIARWAKAAESRGVTLVPISAVASKSKSS
jgi:polysaccharide deacetylase 2 family uncharacterized protein YibQ